MQAFLTSTTVVTLGEIGDKTQLLAMVLATRFKRPLPIIGGILCATLANHFLAALVGAEAAAMLDAPWFRYLVALSFIGMAIWTLIPDEYEDGAEKPSRFGPFLTTLVAFFLVEMGDKTQVATIALGARFHDVLQVTAGTTTGMLLADVPAVFLSKEIAERMPLGTIRLIAALMFLAIGLWLLAQTAGWL